MLLTESIDPIWPPLRPKAQRNAENQDVYQSGSIELRQV